MNGYATTQAVRALHQMVQKHASFDYEFVCITDETDALAQTEGIRCVRPYEHWAYPGWWQKLCLFSEEALKQWGIEGRCLFLDLDVILMNDLKGLLELDDPFVLPPEFYTGAAREQVANTSVMVFTAGKQHGLWSMAEAASHHNWGGHKSDQSLINSYLRRSSEWAFMSPEHVISLKKDVLLPKEDLGLRNIRDPHRPLYDPHEAIVVSCHGDQKPWSELLNFFVQQNYPMSPQQKEDIAMAKAKMTIGPMKVKWT